MEKFTVLFTVVSLLPYIQHVCSLLVKVFTCGKGYCATFSSEDDILATNPRFHCGTGDRLASGPIFGRWFFGWITITRSRDYTMVDSIIWFIKRSNVSSTPTIPKSLSYNDEDYLDDPREALHRFKVQMTAHQELRKVNKPPYRDRPIRPHPWQKRLVTTITETAKKNGACVALITGGPGQGKSTLAELIGRELKPTEDDPIWLAEYDPTMPNSYGAHLIVIERARRSGAKTIIFCIDEVDKILDDVFNGHEHVLRVSGQQNMPTCPHGSGKRSWNTLLDELAQPYEGIDVIVLMTSNRSYTEIIRLVGGDVSVLRSKRVHISFSLTSDESSSLSSLSTEEVDCSNGASAMPAMRPV